VFKLNVISSLFEAESSAVESAAHLIHLFRRCFSAIKSTFLWL